MKRHGLILWLFVAVSTGGCAGTGVPARSTLTMDQALSESSSTADATQRLRQLAAFERDGRAEWATPRQVAPPPGVDPQALALDPDADRVARPLDEVIVEFRSTPIEDETEGAFSGPPPTEDERAEAQAAYEKGVAAIDSRQFYIAVIELEKAHRLNPTDGDILEALAQASRIAGNRNRAMELYRRLFAVDPSRSSVALELANDAMDRREYAQAGAILSRAWTAPGENLAMDYMLGVAMRQLRYEVAAETLLLSAAQIETDQVDTGDPNSMTARIYRQRGEMWRGIGDLRCRLGRFDDALEAYETASELPLTDPASLRPRRMYAHLALGEVFSAQIVVVDSITGDEQSNLERTASELAFLRSHAEPIEPLSAALLEQYAATGNSKRDADLLRVVAGVLPAEQVGHLYQAHLERHPDDTAAVVDLIAGRAAQDVSAAIELAVEVTTERPELVTDIVPRLREAVDSPGAIIDALQQQDDSPEAARLHASLLAGLGAPGPAWDVVESARARWPGDSTLAVQQLMIAASMGETMLARRLIDSLPAELTPMQQVAVASARQLIGDEEQASQRAGEAVEAAGDVADVPLLSTAAAVQLAVAQSYIQQYQMNSGAESSAGLNDAQQKAHAAAIEATDLARRALDHDPANEAAFGVLVGVYSSSGAMPDAEQYAELLTRMRDADPDGPLYARIEAEQAIRRRRHEFAIERLITLLQSHPNDQQALELLLLAWRSKGDTSAAQRWLDAQLQAHPDNPSLLRYWAELSIAHNESNAVLTQLNDIREQQPENQQIANLLEQVHRSLGNQEEATALAEQRLMSRPQAAGRELELAAMYAGASDDEQSIIHLNWLIDHAPDATPRQLSEAVTVATRLQQTDVIERDRMALRLVDAAVGRDPELQLQTYGQGLLALARLVDFGEEVGDAEGDDPFEAMVRTAARSAAGASGPSLAAALRWRDMAQAMIDTGEVRAASRAIRIRLDRGIEANRAIRAAERTGPADQRDPGLDRDALMVLVRCTIILDVAVNDPEHTIELLEQLDRQGQLVELPGMDGNVRLDEALYLAGGLNTVLGNESGAETILRRLIEISPDHSMGLNNLGYQRIDENHDDEETVRWVERAFELAPHVDNILDTYGWLKYKQGDFGGENTGAVSFIQQAIDASTAASADPGVEVLDHLGDALWRVGRTDDARAAWRRLEAYIDRPGFEQYIVQSYRNFQAGPQSWSLLVVDPAEIYERDYGSLLRRARMKLLSAEEGAEPVIAPTFDEAHGRNAN